MVVTKKHLIEIIESIPTMEFASLSEAFSEISLIYKIEAGLADLQQGRVISEEELDEEINKW